VVGAGGYGRQVLAAVLRAGGVGTSDIEVVGFLDDNPDLWGLSIAGLPVLGSPANLPADLTSAVLGVGYPETKAKLIHRLTGTHLSWPSIVHRDASIGTRIELAQGTLVQAGAVVSTDVEVDRFASINLGATVSHDARIGAFASVSPGANLGGGVVVEEGAFIGIGAVVQQGVRIGAWSVVGAGAVVLRDVPPNSVVAGVPARILRHRDEGWWNG